jgi:hypothetical protein
MSVAILNESVSECDRAFDTFTLGVVGPCRQRRVRIDLTTYSVRSLARTRQGAQQEESIHPFMISAGCGFARGQRRNAVDPSNSGYRSGESTTLCNRFGGFRAASWHLPADRRSRPEGDNYAWLPLIGGGLNEGFFAVARTLKTRSWRHRGLSGPAHSIRLSGCEHR